MIKRGAPSARLGYGPMFNGCLIGSLMLYGCVLYGQTRGAHWRVEAELVDGTTLNAFLDGTSFGFDALSVTGDPVRIAVSEPPEWSSLKMGCSIEWVSDRRVFVVRTIAWTGEVERLHGRLLVLDSEGQSLELDFSQLQRARFRFVSNG